MQQHKFGRDPALPRSVLTRTRASECLLGVRRPDAALVARGARNSRYKAQEDVGNLHLFIR
jgi:hypothetical protein